MPSWLRKAAAALLRARAERRLTEQDARRFFDLSRDLLVIAGFDGRLLAVNPAWELTLGWSQEELTSRPFLDFIHPDDVAATLAEYGRANAGNPVVRFANRYRHKGGSYRWLEWSATVDVAARRSYAVARDVTELRHLERELTDRVQQLHDANQELEAFSYSVSHDLRAPLRHIAGFANLLTMQSGAALGSDARRWLEIIQTSTRRMGELIDDLLAFSRIGRVTLSAQPVDLGALVQHVWDELRESAAARPVAWALRPLPAVLGDRATLRVAFVNLLSNALKYSGGRVVAEIVVEGHVQAGEARIAVRDNGVGFDMRYADKLFGVFQRLHSADQFEGTGIGLATVRRIVQRHGGRVWAEAEPDRGATFWIALPAAAREHAA